MPTPPKKQRKASHERAYATCAFTLEREQAEELDTLAKQHQLNKSEVVRRMFSQSLQVVVDEILEERKDNE